MLFESCFDIGTNDCSNSCSHRFQNTKNQFIVTCSDRILKRKWNRNMGGHVFFPSSYKHRFNVSLQFSWKFQNRLYIKLNDSTGWLYFQVSMRQILLASSQHSNKVSGPLDKILSSKIDLKTWHFTHRSQVQVSRDYFATNSIYSMMRTSIYRACCFARDFVRLIVFNS